MRNGVGALGPFTKDRAHEGQLAGKERPALAHRRNYLLQHVLETALDGDVTESAMRIPSLELRYTIGIGIERSEIGEDDVVFDASSVRRTNVAWIGVHRVDELAYLRRGCAQRDGVA